MTYTVLARRYRSQNFDEVIGQEPIARTLQRAIESERTAHAYLFSGTRGVGKTSMARIFAKALNVNDSLTDADEIAGAIMAGNDIDVIEIDGASNRGVDDARELISNSIYVPARCKYKIYIIDEVHMLTKEAFNALLKTMEEPPAHVKFILCTTEPAKVPATIQSRCQRFDFRAIPTARIAEHLNRVLKSEGIKADAHVVEQVARLGNGSMRDALSLLDRLMATGDNRLTADHLQQMLGLPDLELIESLVNAIAASDPASVLRQAGELMARGVSIDQVIESVIQHARHLLLISVGADQGDDGPMLLELTTDRIAQLKPQAEQFDPPTLVHLIVLLESVQRNGRHSASARALFEAALVRLAMPDRFVDAAQAVASGQRSLTAPAPPAPKKKALVPAGPDGPASTPASRQSVPRSPETAPPDRSVPAPVARAAHPTAGLKEREEAASIPLVRLVMDLLDARIVDVKTGRISPG